MFSSKEPSAAQLWGRPAGLVLSVAVISLLSTLGLISFAAFRLRDASGNWHGTPKYGVKGVGEEGCCDLSVGEWKLDVTRTPLYTAGCPFLKDSVKCAKNKRPEADALSKWKWVPKHCELPRIHPASFLRAISNMNIGFVGDSMNENFVTSLLCTLRAAGGSVENWTRKGPRRSAFFPMYNVTGLVLADAKSWTDMLNTLLTSAPCWGSLDDFRWHQNGSGETNVDFSKGTRVDVDIPAKSWSDVLPFYHVIVLNTGHWWTSKKFPPAEPLLFFRGGKQLFPPLDLRAGFQVVVQEMISFVERAAQSQSLKLWRTQSPRHFEGGDWDENGSCTSTALLNVTEVSAWFSLEYGGVNREERELNDIVTRVVESSTFQFLEVATMSEFRRDAHPGAWAGRNRTKDSPQDCSHWCLPGVPDVWVDMLAATMCMQVSHRTRHAAFPC